MVEEATQRDNVLPLGEHASSVQTDLYSGSPYDLNGMGFTVLDSIKEDKMDAE